MTVYHGSFVEVRNPDLSKCRPEADFGAAFYLTSFQAQAERWARRQGLRHKTSGIVNRFSLKGDWSRWRVLHFSDVNEEWLDFVLACRSGERIWQQYDIIMGRVANDDVYRTIAQYVRHQMSKTEAIKQLRYAKPNDQIAITNPEAIADLLKFEGSYEVID